MKVIVELEVPDNFEPYTTDCVCQCPMGYDTGDFENDYGGYTCNYNEYNCPMLKAKKVIEGEGNNLKEQNVGEALRTIAKRLGGTAETVMEDENGDIIITDPEIVKKLTLQLARQMKLNGATDDEIIDYINNGINVEK